MSGRSFKSWPGGDDRPDTHRKESVPTPASCPYCGATDFELLPDHLRYHCEESGR